MALTGLVSSERIGVRVLREAVPYARFMAYVGRSLKWIATWTARLVLAFGLGIGPPLLALTGGGYLRHLHH